MFTGLGSNPADSLLSPSWACTDGIHSVHTRPGLAKSGSKEHSVPGSAHVVVLSRFVSGRSGFVCVQLKGWP